MSQGKVISLEMKKTEMGNRGSKSVINITVKEQRIDGSLVLFNTIRFILRRREIRVFKQIY